MKYLILLIFLSLFNIFCRSQSSQLNPFVSVSVPDSVNLKLAKITYKVYKDINHRTGLIIYNLENRRDFVFKDGIYSFEGFGPHFPRRLFIFNNGNIYIFENIGSFNPSGVLKEFVENIGKLNLNDNQVVLYSKLISEYLQDEVGLTYGSEIKK